jgi:TnpA family transposase
MKVSELQTPRMQAPRASKLAHLHAQISRKCFPGNRERRALKIASAASRFRRWNTNRSAPKQMLKRFSRSKQKKNCALRGVLLRIAKGSSSLSMQRSVHVEVVRRRSSALRSIQWGLRGSEKLNFISVRTLTLSNTCIGGRR